MPTLRRLVAVGGVLAVPKTDWSKVNLEALRQHLIDMNEVTLKAAAATGPVDGGVAVTVTGSGRTLAAIRRMIPEHAAMINGHDGWSAKSAPLPNGVLFTVTAADPKVSGMHHQPHHLAIAKGEFAHEH
ncbi:MAG TPA: hypothetical protein VGS13_15900 [Stellaceae bacterium]|nr:hypothetical protein [Stellaceae bacterium]